MDIEMAKLEQERNIAKYNAEAALETQVGLAVITLGQNALKSAVLINGGAAVALLAFIGNVWGKEIGKDILVPLADSMRHFTYGVLMAAMGGGATYCCQHLYQLRKTKLGLFFQFVAIGLVIASYYYFYSGAECSYDAFINKSKSLSLDR